MLNKNKLNALGTIKVVSGSDDYVEAMKGLYADVYGQWADTMWEMKVNKRIGHEISSEFVKEKFGDEMGYTMVVTKNQIVAFFHCANYYMNGSDDNVALLGLIGLCETLETTREFASNLEIINFNA